MKFYYLLYTVVALIFTQSCSSKGIHGHIDIDRSTYDSKVYLIDPVTFHGIATSYAGKVIDSSLINAQGQFQFANPALTTADYLYFIAFQKKGQLYKNQLHNDSTSAINYFPIIMKKGSSIELDIKASKLPASVKILNGDNLNVDLQKFVITRHTLFSTLKGNGHQASHDENTLLDYEHDLYQYQVSLTNEAKKYNSYLIDILALRWASIEANYERIPELVKEISHRWQGKAIVPSWQQAVDVLSAKLPLSMGDVFPDYDLPMTDGSATSLRKKLGTTITLIDMWASWCAPCRKENRATLVPLWDQHHNEGFQIIGYALDSDDEVWKKAIVKDGADRWLHASHLKGDESPFFELLKISTIPSNYLLDADGTIIAKNLHGENLVDFVNLYLAKK